MEILEEALKREAERQYQRYMIGGFREGRKRHKHRARLQRKFEQAKLAQGEASRGEEVQPYLERLEKLRGRAKVSIGRTPLSCPKCGEADRGNRLNGQPWCFTCNVLLRR